MQHPLLDYLDIIRHITIFQVIENLMRNTQSSDNIIYSLYLSQIRLYFMFYMYIYILVQ